MSTAETKPSGRTLANVPLFGALSAEQARDLDARCLWRRVAGGEWVIDYQAEGADVYFVLSGLARVVIVSSGREMILRDIRQGEYFGQYSAIDGKPRSAAIVAVSDTLVARMPASLFWAMIHEHAELREKVLKGLVADLRAINLRASEQVNFSVRQRLCAELLRLSRVTGEGRVVASPPPTHAELAARIGTHREAVTKTLSSLEKTGLIERAASGIRLPDTAGLTREVAAED